MVGDEGDGGKAARDEARLIVQHAEVHALRDLATQTALMCQRSVPEPSLDVHSELSTNVEERQRQLFLRGWPRAN